MSDIVQRLWDSDQASALTNEAAREIEHRDWTIEQLTNKLSQVRGVAIRAQLNGNTDETVSEILRLTNTP
jgi:hypothetical protein